MTSIIAGLSGFFGAILGSITTYLLQKKQSDKKIRIMEERLKVEYACLREMQKSPERKKYDQACRRGLRPNYK